MAAPFHLPSWWVVRFLRFPLSSHRCPPPSRSPGPMGYSRVCWRVYPAEPRWHFPSALSPEAHAEWGLYKILEYMGLHEILPPGAGQNRAKLRKDIEEYHTAYASDFDDTDIDTFIARRPDGLAFDKGKNYVYSWNTREPWTRMKTEQKRRSKRKMTDIAPI